MYICTHLKYTTIYNYQKHNRYKSIIYDKICRILMLSVNNITDSYTQMTYDCTETFLSVTIFINDVISFTKQIKIHRSHNIGWNNKMYKYINHSFTRSMKIRTSYKFNINVTMESCCHCESKWVSSSQIKGF